MGHFPLTGTSNLANLKIIDSWVCAASAQVLPQTRSFSIGRPDLQRAATRLGSFTTGCYDNGRKYIPDRGSMPPGRGSGHTLMPSLKRTPRYKRGSVLITGSIGHER